MKQVRQSFGALLFLFTSIVFAQQGINYKALVKDNSGNAVANDLVVMEFSIIQSTASGPTVYQETHTVTSDNNGFVMVNIGEGTPVLGTFNAIDWGGAAHFLNVQVNTGAGLVDMGTTEFKTVPYALSALSSSDSYWSQSTGTVFNNSDDIGIGTGSPDGKLGIFHNSSLSDPHIYMHENGNDYARLNFKNNNGANYWSIAAYIASNNKNDRFNIWNGTSGDVMTITGDGEVGIGVGISPKVNLHVGNQKRVLFGTDTLGNGSKLMWLPDLGAFRVGTLSTGTPSTYWNPSNIGSHSFASGQNTQATGFASSALGSYTEATGSYSLASGYQTNATSSYSTAMGYNTDATGAGSTALGFSTDAPGAYSTSMGLFTLAGSYASTAVGRYNVGSGSSSSWVTSDPVFEVGIGTSTSSRSNALTILKNGKVGIGTSSPNSRLQITGGTDASLSYGSGFLVLGNEIGTNIVMDSNEIMARSNGSTATLYLQQNGGAVAVNGAVVHSSDERLKKDIKYLDYGLDAILELKPVSYYWKDRPEQKHESLGLIAQDVKKIIEEVVYIDEDEMNTHHVDYTALVPVLIKAIQEQQSIIDQQQSLITGQSAKLEKQAADLEKLKAWKQRINQALGIN